MSKNTELMTLDFQEMPVRMTVDEQNKPWWVARDACAVLDIAWGGTSLDIIPEKNKGMRKISTLGGSQNILCIDRNGLLRLIARSTKPEAEKFQDWIFDEVLPSVLDTGKYDIQQSQLLPLQDHLKRETQLAQSKAIGSRVYRTSGREGLIEYFTSSIKMKTDMTPKQIKKIGEERGLKSKQRSSARETLRHLAPSVSAEISLMDNLHLHMNLSVEQAHQLSESAGDFFNKAVEIGLTSARLEQLSPAVDIL